MGTTSAVLRSILISGSISIERRRPITFNKIFILGRKITMSEKAFAVLYCNRQGSSMIAIKKSYVRRTDAMLKFQKGVKFLEEDYDGYSYVALMHRVKLTGKDVEVWKMEAFADNVGVRHGR